VEVISTSQIHLQLKKASALTPSNPVPITTLYIVPVAAKSCPNIVSRAVCQFAELVYPPPNTALSVRVVIGAPLPMVSEVVVPALVKSNVVVTIGVASSLIISQRPSGKSSGSPKSASSSDLSRASHHAVTFGYGCTSDISVNGGATAGVAPNIALPFNDDGGLAPLNVIFSKPVLAKALLPIVVILPGIMISSKRIQPSKVFSWIIDKFGGNITAARLVQFPKTAKPVELPITVIAEVDRSALVIFVP
jgi:hypothetical protein